MQRDVASALERDLLAALIACLTTARRRGAKRHRVQIMARFEDVLACHQPLEPHLPEMAAAVGTSERNLRLGCADFLGMSPGQYARLRRLNLVRAALRRADPVTARVGAIAKHYGFSDLGRFAGAYRAAFGEVPSATLSGARCKAQSGRAAERA